MRQRRYSILRNVDLGDCTGGGLSSKVASTTMFWDCTRNEAIDYCIIHDMKPELQMFLHKRELWGEDHSFAEPLIMRAGMSNVFGGNYMVSDSAGYKFRNERIVRPIPIHDRLEEWQP